MAKESTNASASSEEHHTVETPLKEKQPTHSRDASYVTPSMAESGPKPSSELSATNATPPIDFSTLTPADFGITPESFTKQNKRPSKSLLNKSRRRSTIGIRSSPEHNSLIRFIAHRRRTRNQEDLVQASPFRYRNTFLKDKIAAFQSSFKPPEEAEERQIYVADTSKEISSKPHEQSEPDQVSPSECESILFEENAIQKSISEGRSSPDTHERFIVSPSLKPDTEKGINMAIGEHAPAPKEAVPSLLASSTTSGCISLETTPSKGVSKTACELTQNATSQRSCKKVRFAKEQSLEIFDKTKPPITPGRRSHLSPSSVRSVLKKTPIKLETEDKEVGIEHHYEHADETRREEFSTGLGDIPNEGSTKPIDEITVKNEDLGSEVHDPLLPMNIPLHKKRRNLLSSPDSREGSPKMAPGKQSFSQPDFDHDEDQESSEVASAPESSANCALEVTTESSLHLKPASVRITRSSAKIKHDDKAEEADSRLTGKMQIKNSKQKPSGIQKAKPATKSSEKKKPAARRKVFGKKKRRKKGKKALYGQREAVSKIPLLSPIPEVREDFSLMSSYQNTPESQTSIFDYSISSVLNGESVSGTAETSFVQKKEDGGCLHPDLDLLKRLDRTFSQLQGDATNVLKNIPPFDSPIKNSPEKLMPIFQENEQVLKNDCTSGKSEIQEELELLHLHGTGKNTKTEGAAHLSVESVAQLTSESDSADVRKFPRRSRRVTFYLPNHSETPGNISTIPEGNMEEPPPVSDGFELLNSLQCDVEASASSTSRRVRRSMRLHKDAENEGLVWIQIPADHVQSQDPLDSSCNIQSGMSSFAPQESELLHEKKVNSIPLPFMMSEDQENAHVRTVLPKLKKRKSIGVLRAKENDSVVLCAPRNRRASIGYKSDHCFPKGSEMRQFLKTQPTVSFQTATI